MEDDESIPPAYQPPSRNLRLSTRSGIVALSARGDRSLNGGLPSALPSSCLTLHYPQSFLQMEPHETSTYTYNLFASNTHLQIFIFVESEPHRPNHYTFSLSVKIGYVERALSTPVTMKLSVDPRRLEFIVFVFSPRSSLPTGCLYHLRVWMRTMGVDHRMFAEKYLWFGKDPDFCSVADASFAYLRNATPDMSIYQGLVGRAHVSFIFRWTIVEPGTYALSLDYEAGGAGRTLFENYHLRLYCEPQTVSFVIYSIPIPSTPAGASHRLRVWLRTPHTAPRSQPQPLPAGPISTESYLYLRLWKSDDFKIGARLSFESVGDKLILATPGWTSSEHDSLASDSTPGGLALARNHRRMSRLVAPSLGVEDPGNSVDDR